MPRGAWRAQRGNWRIVEGEKRKGLDTYRYHNYDITSTILLFIVLHGRSG